MSQENIQEETKKVSVHQFHFETALYKKININDIDLDIFQGEVDAYSYLNGIETTYSISNDYGKFYLDTERKNICSGGYTRNGFLGIDLKCKRKNNDIIRTYIFIEGDTIVKVGQYPSLADLQFAEIGKRYDKVLNKDDLKNFKKAIGLHAHGSGAGSFVYLRRIFENLICNTFKENNGKTGITLKDFEILKMSEKIEKIKDYLPKQFSGLMNVYKILSVGVHTLSEDDCLKYFNVLKVSIELILDEKIKMNEEKDKSKRVESELVSFSQEIKESEQQK